MDTTERSWSTLRASRIHIALNAPRVCMMESWHLFYSYCIWLAANGPDSRFLVGKKGWKWYLPFDNPTRTLTLIYVYCRTVDKTRHTRYPTKRTLVLIDPSLDVSLLCYAEISTGA